MIDPRIHSVWRKSSGARSVSDRFWRESKFLRLITQITERKQFRQFSKHCYKQFQWQWLLHRRLQVIRAKAMYSKSAFSARESKRVNGQANHESHDRLQNPPKVPERDPLSIACKLQHPMGSITSRIATTHSNHWKHWAELSDVFVDLKTRLITSPLIDPWIHSVWRKSSVYRNVSDRFWRELCQVPSTDHTDTQGGSSFASFFRSTVISNSNDNGFFISDYKISEQKQCTRSPLPLQESQIESTILQVEAMIVSSIHPSSKEIHWACLANCNNRWVASCICTWAVRHKPY